jgi:FkbM family methyltransferase
MMDKPSCVQSAGKGVTMEKNSIFKEMIKLTVPGILHPVILRPNTSDEAMYSQIFLNDEYGYLGMMRPPTIIVDAGANIGLSSIYFANKYKDAMIIAIEPDGNNFYVLERNTVLYKNIFPVKAALWPQEGMVSLRDPGLGECAYQTYRNYASVEKNNIRCVTVDSILLNYGIDHIDLLKIDIEGAETEVFNDQCDWLSKVKVLIIELHERLKAGCNRAFFAAIKGHFDYEWTGGENFYLSRLDEGQPLLPGLFKNENPHLLPVEELWGIQAELGRTRQELGENQAELGRTRQELGENQAELGRTRQELGENQAELGRTRQELGENQAELGRTRQELGENQAELSIIYNSNIWKILQPVREVINYIRKVLRLQET